MTSMVVFGTRCFLISKHSGILIITHRLVVNPTDVVFRTIPVSALSLEVTIRGEKSFPGFKLNAGNLFFQIPHVLIRVKMYIWYLQDILVTTTF